MAPQSTSSAGYLPYYARPTAASESRRSSNNYEVCPLKAANKQVERKSKASDLKFLRDYGHTLSPSVWRSKARWLGPFRFFGLPGELRNRVYEYAAADQASQYMSLYHSDRPVRLPPLLAASKQLCIEAGCYYFNNDYCRMVIYGFRISTLQHWLNTIGRANREHMANYQNVRLSFAFSPRDFTQEEHAVLSTATWVRVISLSDAAHAVGLGSNFDNLADKHPALKTWQLQSRQRYSSNSFVSDFRERNFAREYAEALESTTAIPESFIEWLRPVLRRLLELLGGTRVDVREPKIRKPDG